jgi:hypothetical protein
MSVKILAPWGRYVPRFSNKDLIKTKVDKKSGRPFKGFPDFFALIQGPFYIVDFDLVSCHVSSVG